VPTGIALDDARARLFDAAERVLLRDGANALTSRAVTAEADCAKGVLHRHFVDFDGFLVELVSDRARRLGARRDGLLAQAGTGSIVGNLSGVLPMVFGPLALRIVGLVIGRDELRARLGRGAPGGIPVLREAVAMVAGYLAAERELGRLVPSADVDRLALTLVGAAHLLFTSAVGGPSPEPAAVAGTVATVLAGALPAALPPPR